MITYAEAVRIVDDHTSLLGNDVRPLAGCSGSRLGKELRALCDSPPFDNSAVDGYGRREEDLGARLLPLAGEVQAGDDGRLNVRPGHAVRIFTGAPVPSGIVSISMQEDCEEVDGRVRFSLESKPGQHIRPAGSDFRKGETLLPEGTILDAPKLGLALSGGHSQAECRIRPRVLILTTGNELVAPGELLGPGQIYNSNSGALFEAARPLSSRTQTMNCGDDPEQLRSMMPGLLNDNDVLITCGGVSVGAHDYLKEAFASAHVTELFWSVAIKPGKPIFFGSQGKALVFGLPGNPVSALVTFFLFVRPALLKMAGSPDPWPRPFHARFEGKCSKRDGRMEFLRGILTGESVRLVGGRDSHLISGLAAANCLIHFPLEATELRDGDVVDVTALNWM